MIKRSKWWTPLIAAAALVAAAAHAADPGVFPDKIKFGKTSILSGFNVANGTASSEGILAYFDKVNAAGGVGGRKVELVLEDDAYKGEIAKIAANKLINEHKVFAMLFANGTEATKAIFPITTAAKVPLIGSTSGSIMRDPKEYSRYYFNIRNANYDDAKGIIEHVAGFGFKDIGVIYQNNSFGRSGFKEFKQAAKDAGLNVSFEQEVPANMKTSQEAEEFAKKAIANGVRNIAMFTIDDPTGAFIKSMREKGSTVNLYAVTTSGNFENAAGKYAEGTIVSLTVPALRDNSKPIVKEFREAIKKRKKDLEFSAVAFEGFLTAKIAVEALRLAGKEPTRESFVNALESFKDKDFGGIYISYDTPAHEGTRYNELIMFGKDNQIVF